MSDTKKLKSIPVTRLVRLGTQAPTFDLPVDVTKLDGGQAKLVLVCKAMRKTEWAQTRDTLHAKALEALRAPVVDEPAADDGVVVDAVGAALANLLKQGQDAKVREGLTRDAEAVLEFATGWDLEDDFNAVSLMALEDEFGGSLSRILTAYDLAIYQGRLGN